MVLGFLFVLYALRSPEAHKRKAIEVAVRDACIPLTFPIICIYTPTFPVGPDEKLHVFHPHTLLISDNNVNKLSHTSLHLH